MNFKLKLFIFVPIMMIPLVLLGLTSYYSVKNVCLQNHQEIVDKVLSDALFFAAAIQDKEDLLAEKQKLMIDWVHTTQGEKFKLFLIDKDGQIIFYPASGAPPAQDSPLIAQILSKKTGNLRYPSQGNMKISDYYKYDIYRFSNFAPWEWIFVISSRQAEIMRPAMLIRLVAILSVTLGLTLALLVFVYLIQSLRGPVAEIETGLNEMSQSRRFRRMSPNVHREFGKLAKAFDRLADRLESFFKSNSK